jgi:predicted nicotinamide N-methyase
LLSRESRWSALGRDTGRFVGFVQTLAVVASPGASPEAVWDRQGVDFASGSGLAAIGDLRGDVW